MKLIISKNERKVLRKIYKDLKDFIILDKNQIISTLGYTKEEFKDGLYSQLIINTEIKYFLEKAINNKKNKDVIYIMDTLDRTFFLNLFQFLNEKPEIKLKINELILIDNKE